MKQETPKSLNQEFCPLNFFDSNKFFEDEDTLRADPLYKKLKAFPRVKSSRFLSSDKSDSSSLNEDNTNTSNLMVKVDDEKSFESCSTFPSMVNMNSSLRSRGWSQSDYDYLQKPLQSGTSGHNSMPFNTQNQCFLNPLTKPDPYKRAHGSFPCFQKNVGDFECVSNHKINNLNKCEYSIKNVKPSTPKKDEDLEFNTLEELLNHLKGGKQIGNYIKCRTTTGTMTNLIKKLPSEKITELLFMITQKLKDIMISNNKFCQRFFEVCNAEQRIFILRNIQSQFRDISFNKWGSYSLQAFVKSISSEEEQEIIVKCMEGKVYEFAMDKQANFVLQKLIMVLNEKNLSIITNEILNSFEEVVYSVSGITTLKNIIAVLKGEEIRRRFICKVSENFESMINNSSNHIIILQIFDMWDFKSYKSLIEKIMKNISKYATLKYSSGVVLKMIFVSDLETLEVLADCVNKEEVKNELAKTEWGKLILKELSNKLPKKIRMEKGSNFDVNEICSKSSSINDEEEIFKLQADFIR